jgi:hypothetical protein
MRYILRRPSSCVAAVFQAVAECCYLPTLSSLGETETFVIRNNDRRDDNRTKTSSRALNNCWRAKNLAFGAKIEKAPFCNN